MLIKWYDFKYVYLYGNENQIFRVRNVYRLVCYVEYHNQRSDCIHLLLFVR